MSAKDQIIALPNKHLRDKSRKVIVIDEQVRQVIQQMKDATLDWEASREHEVGVALAAIQVDQPLRIIVIRHNFDNKEDQRFDVFINPEIVRLEGKIEEDFEGCLSIADVYGKVPRYSKIRLKALNESGQEIRVRAEGFLARIIQHEVDHINGKMFIDLIENKPEAFFKLTTNGKLEELPYEQVKKTGIFR